VKVLALGLRRGPASEAQALYEDLKPQTLEGRLPAGTPDALATARREPGAGRPTKRERRALDRLREDS
jgi:ribosome-associated heat shock protein Hsp15